MLWAEPVSFITVSSTCVCVRARTPTVVPLNDEVDVSRHPGDGGKEEGTKLFCLHCTAVLGSSIGHKSHYSDPGLPAPSSCPPPQNTLVESGLLAPRGQGSGLNYNRTVSHFHIKPTKPNPRYSQRRRQPAGVWKWFSPRLDMPSQHKQSCPPSRKALSHQQHDLE